MLLPRTKFEFEFKSFIIYALNFPTVVAPQQRALRSSAATRAQVLVAPSHAIAHVV